MTGERTLARHGVRLTPDGEVYARDLCLQRVGRDTTVAVWVEDDRRSASVALRVVGGEGELGPVLRIPPLSGFPAFPCFLPPERVVWVELAEAVGRLAWASVDVAEGRVGRAERVPGFTSANVGDLACCLGPEGRQWLLAASRDPDSRLLLGSWPEPAGEPEVRVFRRNAFFARPRLTPGATGVLASWDEYADGRYRVHTCDLLGAGEPDLTLPAPDGHDETLSALAQATDGAWFAARCRERLVELDGGVAGRHSEIAVSVLGELGWRDVASIGIDHGLNPWMAGYTGARRFPHLTAGRDSVVVFWEEKEDSRTMDPAPARICAAEVGGDGLRGAPSVAAAEASWLVGEHGAAADGTWLASKTQTFHNEQYVPWHLHRFGLGSPRAERPAGLESNRTAPPFRVRAVTGARPTLADRPLSLFFGDPHLHSRFSGDVDGEQDELYHFARDVAQLDFCAFCENDFHRLIEPMSAAIWQQDVRNSSFFDRPGAFTVLVGWEYTKHAEPEERDPVPNSHRCVLFEGATGAVHHYWDAGIRTRTPGELCERFRGERVLLHHHHAQGFDLTDDTLERNIEVCSGWAVCMSNDRFREAVHCLLGRGFRLGFIGGSDNHERNPGLGGALTGVWARENTREGIFEAFSSRRVFATTGLRPDVRFRVAGAFMGEAVCVDAPPAVELSVRCEVPVQRVEVVRDGEVVYAEDCSAESVAVRWDDTSCLSGPHVYYAHVGFSGGECNPYWNIANAYGANAWTSPVWVTR